MPVFILFIIVSAFLTAKHFFGVYADSDIFWHLKTGLDILRTRALLTTDPYSFQTSGLPWINHEWLAEVIFASFYSSFGTAGLLVLRGILLFSILISLSAHIGSSIISFLLLWFSSEMLAYFFPVQPALFSAFFFAYLMTIVWNLKISQFWLWTIPFVFALWANIHGGFVLGLGFLLVSTYKNPAKFWCFVGSVAATFLNPYGLDLYRYITQELLSSHAYNGFWLPMTPVQAALPILFGILALASFLKTQPARNFLSLGLVLVLVGASVKSQRIFPFLLIACLIFSAPFLMRLHLQKKIFTYPAMLFLILFSLLKSFDTYHQYGFALRIDHNRYPVKAIDFLTSHYTTGDIALPFDWGGFTLFHTAPDFKVSADGRHISLYTEELMRRNIEGIVHSDLDLFLKDIHPDFLLLPTAELLTMRANASKNFQKIYEDRTATLFKALSKER